MYKDTNTAQNHIKIALSQVVTACLIIGFVFVIPATIINTQNLSAEEVIPYTAEALNLRQREVGESSVVAISELENANNESGQVAGVVTSASNLVRIPFTSFYIDFNSRSGLLSLAGTTLVVMGIGMLVYVIVSDKPKQLPTAEAFDRLQFEQRNLERWNSTK